MGAWCAMLRWGRGSSRRRARRAVRFRRRKCIKRVRHTHPRHSRWSVRERLFVAEQARRAVVRRARGTVTRRAPGGMPLLPLFGFLGKVCSFPKKQACTGYSDADLTTVQSRSTCHHSILFINTIVYCLVPMPHPIIGPSPLVFVCDVCDRNYVIAYSTPGMAKRPCKVGSERRIATVEVA
jgi:hypothetical protein